MKKTYEELETELKDLKKQLKASDDNYYDLLDSSSVNSIELEPFTAIVSISGKTIRIRLNSYKLDAGSPDYLVNYDFNQPLSMSRNSCLLIKLEGVYYGEYQDGV